MGASTRKIVQAEAVETVGDPDLLRACRNHRKVQAKVPVEDLPEDWAAVRGYPPYGYVLDWPDPEIYALLRVVILGVRRHSYITQLHSVLAKSEMYKVVREQRGLRELDRSGVCFTRTQLERQMVNEQRQHTQRLGFEIRRLSSLLQPIQEQLAWHGEGLSKVAEMSFRISKRTWDKIPKTKAEAMGRSGVSRKKDTGA